MNRTANTLIGAALLALSGNAAAVLIADHPYGISDYRLDELDTAIQALADRATTRADQKRLKKARKLDRKVERLAGKLYEADSSGDSGTPSRKHRKLVRKETKLLEILAGLLPVAENVVLTTSGSIGPGDFPAIDIPPPPLEALLPLPREIIDPVDSDPFSLTMTGPGPVAVIPAVTAAVPEPPLPVLLGLGMLVLLGHRRLSRGG